MHVRGRRNLPAPRPSHYSLLSVGMSEEGLNASELLRRRHNKQICSTHLSNRCRPFLVYAKSPYRSRSPQVAMGEESRGAGSHLLTPNFHPNHGYLPSLSWRSVLNLLRNAQCTDWRTCSTRSRTCLRFPSSIDTRKDCRPSGVLLTATVRLPPMFVFGSDS